jgi:hypothetical protein
MTALVAALVLTACSGGSDEVNGGTPAASATASATAAAAPAPTPTAATGGGGGAAGTPRCTSAELTVTLGPSEGAAGSVYRPLVFANTGNRTCELTGFPGVSYVAGDDGHQIGPAAEMSGPRGGEVRMTPGGSSAAQLQLVQVLNFDPAVCRPTPVRGLRIYPPGETASLFVPMDGTGCAGNPPGPQLVVKTIAPR